MPYKKKKKKSKPRVLVEGPKVSDPNVIRQLDKDRNRVQEEIEQSRDRQSRRFGGYGLDDYDPAAGVAMMMALAQTVQRKVRKRVVENTEEETVNEESSSEETGQVNS